MKNLYYLLIIIFTVSIAATGEAQGWQRVYNQPGPNLQPGRVLTAAILPDGGSLMFGESPNHVAFLTRTDENGSIVWRKYLAGFTTSIRADLVILPNGRFVLANYSDGGNNNRVGLFESTGDSIWMNKYTGLVRMRMTDTGCLIGQRLNTSQFKLIQLNGDGQPVWEKSFSSSSVGFMGDVRQIDGGYAVLMTSLDYKAKLYRIDSLGNILWERVYTDATANFPGSLEYDAFTKQFTFLSISNNSSPSSVTQTDSLGNVIWSNNLAIGSHSLLQTPDGFVVCGYSALNHVILIKLNKTGSVVFTRDYLPQNLACSIFDIRPTPDNGILIAGSAGGHALLIKTNASGNIFSTYLLGSVTYDQNHDCAYTSTETGLRNWPIIAKRQSDGQDFYATTDPDGQYQMGLDTGIYAVRIQPQGYLWKPCQTEIIVNLNTLGDTATVNFSIQDSVLCSLLDVSIGTNILRRCFNSQYVISWCNTGTMGVEEASVDLILPPQLDYVSSSLPLSGQAGDTLHFGIGAVDFGECGSMTLVVNADCDSTTLGQTLCVEARIYPDTLCALPANWSGAQVVASAQCLGDTAVEFHLRNVGTTPTWPDLEYIITEDLVVLMRGPFNLNPGEEWTLVRPANGGMQRIAAQQEPNFPFSSQPAAAIEGCGLNGPVSFGFINLFPVDDGSPFVDVDCQEVVGSFDPNDKQGFPTGYGDQHLIEPETALTYLIRFQNTGTDTAFTVVVRDTLSPWLDPASVRPGASSHPCTWSLTGTGALAFRFDDILLPDSNVNEAASHGFVQFRISQRPGVPLGTQVLNRAGIYFDFNAPVMTNTTQHTIQQEFYTVSIDQEPAGKSMEVSVMPNPFVEHTRFVLMGAPTGATTFRLFDLYGKLLRQDVFAGNTYEFRPGPLAHGVYVFELRNEQNRVLAIGKMIRQ